MHPITGGGHFTEQETSRRYITLGWQWSCDNHPCPGTEMEPDRRFDDHWQNPDQGASMARAAQAHADRTGHAAFIERHQRRIVRPRKVTHNAQNDGSEGGR